MKPISPVSLTRRTFCLKQHGFTLIELMIAITLGMLILAALLALYLNVTRTNNEMSKANRQIENGRFAIQLLQNDLVHAGFWGEARPAVPTAIPDPCLAVASWDAAYKVNILGIPVQGYPGATVPGTCAATTKSQAGSDLLVVRHADTCTPPVAALVCTGDTDTGPHIQVSSCTTISPPEAAYVIDSASFPLRDKNCTTVAARRKVVSNIYFVSGNTLMRTSLENGAYTTAQPLIEGIEALRVEYGIDTLGKNGLAISATNPGDGSADEFKTSSDLNGAAAGLCTTAGTACNLASNIVTVKIHVLARNLEATPGYIDSKSYKLGGTSTIAAASDGFKRHVFSTTVRLVNPSSRRETPP